MEILRWIVQNYGKEKKEQQEDGRSKQASNEKAQFSICWEQAVPVIFMFSGMWTNLQLIVVKKFKQVAGNFQQLWSP